MTTTPVLIPAAENIATEPGARVLGEIQAGEGLALSAAGRLFPAHRGTGTVNPATVFRWITQGAKSNGGQLVKLEAVRVGGRWLTSRAAVNRFVLALTDTTPPATTSAATAPPRTETARQKASARAAHELAKRGA